jgi:hypothetical protein
VTIHWNGGRHAELRVSRVRCGRYPEDRYPSPVEVDRRSVAGSGSRRRCLTTALPPQHSKFKLGQSGNPAGRPKGALNWRISLTTSVADSTRWC